MKKFMKHTITGEVREFNPDVDKRLWKLLPDEVKQEDINTLTIQAFIKRDEERKAWYYKFFPWEMPKQNASFKSVKV